MSSWSRVAVCVSLLFPFPLFLSSSRYPVYLHLLSLCFLAVCVRIPCCLFSLTTCCNRLSMHLLLVASRSRNRATLSRQKTRLLICSPEILLGCICHTRTSSLAIRLSYPSLLHLHSCFDPQDCVYAIDLDFNDSHLVIEWDSGVSVDGSLQ